MRKHFSPAFVIVLAASFALAGSANLKSEGQTLLKELVGALEQVPYQIVVIGHTDNVPIGPGLAKRYP